MPAEALIYGLRGKVFPLAGASVAGAPPFCGETPQRPLQSESADGFSVTG